MNEWSQAAIEFYVILASAGLLLGGFIYALICLKRSNDLIKKADEALNLKMDEVDALRKELRKYRKLNIHSDS